MHQRPSSLLEHINAATRNTIAGPFGNEKEAAEVAAGLVAADAFAAQDHDGDHFRRNETPVLGGAIADDEQGRPARARYSFDGHEEGELAMTEGMAIEILDDRDPK